MKYKTIVIDPPWKVANGFNKKGFFHGQNKERVLPYKTMTDLEISEFPINNFAEEFGFRIHLSKCGCARVIPVIKEVLPLGFGVVKYCCGNFKSWNQGEDYQI